MSINATDISPTAPAAKKRKTGATTSAPAGTNDTITEKNEYKTDNKGVVKVDEVEEDEEEEEEDDAEGDEDDEEADGEEDEKPPGTKDTITQKNEYVAEKGVVKDDDEEEEEEVEA